jgi:hypothetical protein
MAKKLEGKNQLKVTLLQSYLKVFDSPEGKMVLHDMMKTNGMYSSTFNENPYTMAYLEGRRSMLTDLINVLNKDPEVMYKQFKEQEEIQNMY